MIVFLLGCGSVANVGSGPGDPPGSQRAVQAAEAMAINPATGRPDLTRPSVARLMTYRAALAAMGGGISYALPFSHLVWFVHVYGEPRSAAISYPYGFKPPPLGHEFTVIVDASNGRVMDYNV
jgi:hypothetical protein